MTISRNSIAAKKCVSKPKKLQQNTHQWVEDGSGENKEKNANDTPQTICTGVLYHIKFESSLEHKSVLNYAMPYFVTLMMIDPEFSEDPKNNQINL